MDFGPALGWQELQPGLGVATNTLGSGEHDPERWTSGFLFNYDPAHRWVSVLVWEKGWCSLDRVTFCHYDHIRPCQLTGKECCKPPQEAWKAGQSPEVLGKNLLFLCVLVSVRCALDRRGSAPPCMYTLQDLGTIYFYRLLNHEPNWLLPTHFIRVPLGVRLSPASEWLGTSPLPFFSFFCFLQTGKALLWAC